MRVASLNLLLFLGVGCSPASPTLTSATCAPPPHASACDTADDVLRSCQPAGTRVYGVTGGRYVCTTSYCAGQGPSSFCTESGIVVKRSSGGAPLIITSQAGVYSHALEPGTYELCPERNACNYAGCTPCATVTLATGDVTRVDLFVEKGAFGEYDWMKAQ